MAEEKTEKTRDERLQKVIGSVDRLILICRHLLAECHDNPHLHLHQCPCGRSETRFDRCALCVAEEKR